MSYKNRNRPVQKFIPREGFTPFDTEGLIKQLKEANKFIPNYKPPAFLTALSIARKNYEYKQTQLKGDKKCQS